MDTATLRIAHHVIVERSIRGAARDLQRAPASVAAALDRLEAAISVKLVERAGSGLVLTLEAERLQPDIARAAALAEAMFPDPRGSATLEALWRFAAVAETGSVRKAAHRLKLGQPQLTRQLSALEATLGAPLLVRGSGGSVPTPAGERLLEQIAELALVWTRLSHAAADRFRRIAATTRLGSVMPLGYESELARLLADLTARWLKARPRQPLFVSSTTAEELLAGLKSGRFDAAVLDVETVPPDLEAQLIYRSRLALVGGPEAFPASGDIGGLLASMPVAVPSSRSGLRQAVTRALEAMLTPAQRQTLTLIEIDSIPVIVNLVLRHGFLSVLPEASVGNIRNDLGRIALPEAYALPLWLVWPRRSGARSLGEQILQTIRQAQSPQA